MLFVPTRKFYRALIGTFPSGKEGYFWDALERFSEFQLSEEVSWRKVAAAIEHFTKLAAARPPLFLFTDRLAGWKRVPARNRKSPVSVARAGEALEIIEKRSHFRGGTAYADNYYLTDGTFSWFIAFCHHDDCHIFVSPQRARSKPFTQWAKEYGAERAA